MARFKILQCDDGARHLVGWAKGQANRLFEAGIKTFDRTWMVGGASVRAQSVEFLGVPIVKLWLIGQAMVFNRLYDWPNSRAPKNFVLRPQPVQVAGESPVVVPPNKRITAVPAGVLSPLAYSLHFEVDGSRMLYSVQNNGARLLAHFKLLAKTKKWMLRQWMEQSIQAIYVDRMPRDVGELEVPPPRPQALTLAQYAKLSQAEQDAYQQGVNYWRPALPITFDDCYMSEPVTISETQTTPERIESYFLVGKFRAALDPYKAEFRGVTVPLSTLVALNPTGAGFRVDLSSFNTAITPELKATIHVFQPSEYTRVSGTPPVDYSKLPQVASDSFSQWASSPFSVTYDRYRTTTIKGKASGSPPWDDESKSEHIVEQHSLSSIGEVKIVPYDKTPFEGAFSWSDDWSRPYPAPYATQTIIDSAMQCALTFYSGDTLVRVGDIDFTGRRYSIANNVGSGVDGALNQRSSLSFIGDANYVDEYIPEFGIVRSGTEIVTNLAAREKLSTTSYSYGSVLSNGVIVGRQYPRSDTSTNVGDSPVFGYRLQRRFGSTYALAWGSQPGGVGMAMTPRQSGLPQREVNGRQGTESAVRLSGIFWYRDGPTGVFRFTVPFSKLVARAADCTKYQHVYLKDPGYRAAVLNADGSTKTSAESGYEPLEQILVRIVANTDVILNNFASQDLYPWIDAELRGVIL